MTSTKQTKVTGWTDTHCSRGHSIAEHGRIRSNGWRRCNACERDRARRDPKKTPNRTREQWLKFKYGISQADYDAMFEAQAGLCAVCRKPEVIKDAPLRVDHNHQTGQVRGLLCHHCNVALGHFKDNTALLRAAMEYLDES